MYRNLFSAIGCLLLLASCSVVLKYDNTRYRNTNACKKLRGEVLLYGIFVDSKYTHPWTRYDLNTTIDSVKKAIAWLNEQGKDNNIPLNIQFDYFKGDSIVPIDKKLPKKQVWASVSQGKNPVKKLNRWSDLIAGEAGKMLQMQQKDGFKTPPKPFNRERLIAKLRDDYNVESVALVYFVNNYYKIDNSVAVNTSSNEEVEYAIVSYKYPPVIAHEFLHLFGASDLYRQLYNQKRKSKKLALEYFPTDIMLDCNDKTLEEVKIGQLTKYLIGWQDSIDHKFSRLLIEKYKIRMKVF